MSLIFISSFYLVFTGYFEFKGIEIKNETSFYNIIINNTLFNNYKKISGTNTGYGFYGINVATEAYFSVKVYNNDDEIIYSSTTQSIDKKNALSRFMVLPCSELNSNCEIEKEKNENLKKGINNILSTKENYSNKIFKYIGLHNIKKIDKNKFKYYVVTLYCLNPKNIWNSNKSENEFTKAKIKEIKFHRQ